MAEPIYRRYPIRVHLHASANLDHASSAHGSNLRRAARLRGPAHHREMPLSTTTVDDPAVDAWVDVDEKKAPQKNRAAGQWWKQPGARLVTILGVSGILVIGGSAAAMAVALSKDSSDSDQSGLISEPPPPPASSLASRSAPDPPPPATRPCYRPCLMGTCVRAAKSRSPAPI